MNCLIVSLELIHVLSFILAYVTFQFQVWMDCFYMCVSIASASSIVAQRTLNFYVIVNIVHVVIPARFVGWLWLVVAQTALKFYAIHIRLRDKTKQILCNITSVLAIAWQIKFSLPKRNKFCRASHNQAGSTTSDHVWLHSKHAMKWKLLLCSVTTWYVF